MIAAVSDGWRSRVGALVVVVFSLTAFAVPAVATGARPGSPHLGTLPVKSYLNIDSLAVDRYGGLHEIGTYQDFVAPPSHEPMYVTKPAGSRHVRYRPLTHASADRLEGFDRAFVAVSDTGTTVDVAVSTCHGVYVQRASARSATVPTFGNDTKAVAERRCRASGALPEDLQGIQPLAHGRIALLFSDDPLHPRKLSAPTVFIGRPRGTFRELRLPGGATYRARAAITRDSADGPLYVSCVGNDGATPGYQALEVWVLNADRRTWTGPTVATTLPITPNGSGFVNYDVSSMAASHGNIWIGFQGYQSKNPGAFLIFRNATGHWSAAVRLPGARQDDLARVEVVAVPGRSMRVWELDALAGHATRYTFGDLEVRRMTTGPGLTKARRLTHGAHVQQYAVAARPNGGFAYGYGGD